MSLSEGDIAFAKDLFASLPDLSTRRMFGGLGLYSGTIIFAVMRSDGAILLKATGGAFADKLSERGAEKWTTTRKNGTVSSMPYWMLPADLLEDPDTIRALAAEAVKALS